METTAENKYSKKMYIILHNIKMYNKYQILGKPNLSLRHKISKHCLTMIEKFKLKK